MKIMGVKLTIFLLLILNLNAFAQIGAQGFNPNSVRPVLEYDIMYRTTVWRRINLLEKQNKPFFAIGNEITTVIIQGVKDKKIQPYNTTAAGTFDSPMTHEDFLRKMSYYSASLDDTIDIRPSELYILELQEDLIFDKKRSRMYWDTQSLTMVIPQGTGGSDGPAQLGDITVAMFKFKELYDYFQKTFDESQEKGTVNELKAYWYNPDNQKSHISLSQAFDLRMFSSRIWKVSNPDDKDIVTLVNEEYANDPQAAKKVLYLSQKYEYDLMEFEHNLWEF